MVELRNLPDTKTALTKLISGLENVFSTVQKSLKLTSYAIGLANITTAKKYDFDPKNCNTWNKNGISSKWELLKGKDYGQNGLIVLAAIDKQAIPSICQNSMDQLGYAKELHSKLHEYLKDIADERLKSLPNETYTKQSVAHVLYVAYTLSDEETTKDSQVSLYKSGYSDYKIIMFIFCFLQIL